MVLVSHTVDKWQPYTLLWSFVEKCVSFMNIHKTSNTDVTLQQ